jgi:hypothetical protein
MRRLLLAALLSLWAGFAHAQGTYAIYGDYPNASVTGTLTETLLVSVPIPANSLGPNGLARLTFTATNNNSANTKTINFKVAATAGISGAQVASSAQTTNVSTQFIVFFRNRGATNNNGVRTLITAGPYGATINPAENLPVVDTTQNVVISITGVLTNVADSVTLVGWTLEIMRP